MEKVMYIDLSGIWSITLDTENGIQAGDISIPGILQAQGYGNDITYDTPWVSGLHDSCWFEREEYRVSGERGVEVSFLSRPPKHFLGKAYYRRTFEIKDKTIEYETAKEKDWLLVIELTHWRTKAFIDGVETGGDCSLCTPHQIPCGKLAAGVHEIMVEVDNSMQYPYRPDGHGVSDALGATWNGMAGEVALMTADELHKRDEKKKAYAAKHPRQIEIKNGMFYVDGIPEYFRGTHFGGDYPLTGYPQTDRAWWDRICDTIKEWGFNFIRCHSYCPPEAAFAAADEAGIYLQPECGMWNHFEDGILMLDVLKEETKRILRCFGHHPSFVLFSPTNEPSGEWYHPLRQWVEETRAYDKELGYEGRRLYTAQSGWFYDAEPKEITGTDYLYFHRSAFGPYHGGMIRGGEGWKGKDYSPSLEGAKLPVICHEMGQWCSYPDFTLINKFTGYLQPSNYRVFRENCKRAGLLGKNEEFVYASGRNQVRLYKEDIEANFRTKELYGFEMLDLHDYLGQGTALVGVLDAFWEEKGYVKPAEFRQFCNKTVLLARFSSYIYECPDDKAKNPAVPVEVCHFGDRDLENCVIKWQLSDLEKKTNGTLAVLACRELEVEKIGSGRNTFAGNISLPFDGLQKNSRLQLSLSLYQDDADEEITSNQWELYVYCRLKKGHGDKNDINYDTADVVYTRLWKEAAAALAKGKRVIFSPRLSDLSYECPPVSIKNVFWNAQMGARWGRSMGMLVDTSCPLFQDFPTDRMGGWQWEGILARARAFDIRGFGRSDENPEGVEPIVRIIDDWNRNLPLALIFEVKVDEGSLLVIPIDFETRTERHTESEPAVRALKKALFRYAASDKFCPKVRMSGAEMEKQMQKCLFPTYRMRQMVSDIRYPAQANVQGGAELISANPEKAVMIRTQSFPVSVTLEFQREITVCGLLYVPDQTARQRRGFVREYLLRIKETSTDRVQEIHGGLKNTSLSQEIKIAPILTKELEFSVLSVYGEKDTEEWVEERDGYYKVRRKEAAEVIIGGLHVICEENGEYEEVFLMPSEKNQAAYQKADIEN
ncbi:MAG: hypothetical protein NC321_04580 [Clostridium sp.]|nr:hypothetical protein [Clostridium sp.]